MALTATYNGDLSRIRLAGASLGTSTYAVFDRTTNGITYSTVRGGLHVPVTASAANLDDYEFPADVAVTYRVRSYNVSDTLQATFTTTITQALTQPWLKSISRYFLNREIFAADASDISYKSRAGIFDVVGRSAPVAVTDVHTLCSYELSVATILKGPADDLRFMVTSGDVLFLHTPPDFPSPGGYFVVGDVSESRQNLPWARRWFRLPLTQVAAPAADVVGAVGTWQTVKDTYATWAALKAAKATWADVRELIGDPSEVIVP